MPQLALARTSGRTQTLHRQPLAEQSFRLVRRILGQSEAGTHDIALTRCQRTRFDEVEQHVPHCPEGSQAVNVGWLVGTRHDPRA